MMEVSRIVIDEDTLPWGLPCCNISISELMTAETSYLSYNSTVKRCFFSVVHGVIQDPWKPSYLISHRKTGI